MSKFKVNDTVKCIDQGRGIEYELGQKGVVIAVIVPEFDDFLGVTLTVLVAFDSTELGEIYFADEELELVK